MSVVTVDDRYPISVKSLPQSWTVCMIGEAISEVQSGFASGVHNKEGEGIPHLRPMNVSRVGEIDLSEIKYVTPDVSPLRLSPGDVLFNNTNSPELIGKTAAIPLSVQEVAFSNHMTRLRPPAGLNDRFVARQLHYLWMSGYFQYRCTNHVNQASLSSSSLAKTVPLVVAPALEQDRIADEIEKQFTRLDAATAALKRVQANLNRYRASVLKAACEGRLVPTEAELARKEGRDYESADKLLQRILRERRARWEADTLAKMITSGKRPTDDYWKQKYKEPSSPDTANLPRLPEGWCWARFEQLLREPLRNGHSSKASSDGTGVRTLTLTAVTLGDFSEQNTKMTVASPEKVSSLWLKPGDILIERSNTPELVGIARVFRGESNFAIFPDLLIRARLLESLSVDYVGVWLRSEGTRQYFRTAAQGISGTMPKIDQAAIEEAVVPLPPAAEQQRVSERVSAAEEMLSRTSSSARLHLLRSERLRRSILSSAFAGQLVRHDPTDEPASALLDRIRAERSIAANGAANGRKRRNRDEVSATPR